ncbi:MAG: hypothetical protein ACLSTO_10340 [Bilophila wadsworthia]
MAARFSTKDWHRRAVRHSALMADHALCDKFVNLLAVYGLPSTFIEFLKVQVSVKADSCRHPSGVSSFAHQLGVRAAPALPALPPMASAMAMVSSIPAPKGVELFLFLDGQDGDAS